MKQQHNCEKCIEKSKLYADKSKLFACACQCKKTDEEEKKCLI